MIKIILLFIPFLSIIQVSCVQNLTHIDPAFTKLPAYQVYYAWKKVDYEFKRPSDRSKMINSGNFIQKNVIITVAKIYKSRMFLTTPRYYSGIPACVSAVPYNCDYYAPYGMKKKNPKLKPFPNWEMQKLGNCSAFQFVQSMEIDNYGRLWVVDGGRTAVLEPKPKIRCPPKIVVIDLARNDKILLKYEFPENVVSSTTNLMKDINVACTGRTNCFAYIVDIADNKLIVFDYKKKTSWAVKHPSMAPDPAKTNFTINGTSTSVGFGIAGSALSPRKWKFDTLYYAPIASTSVYSVPTQILKNPPTNRNLKDSQVTELGVRSGQSDGWAMDNTGKLYFGNLPQSSVFVTKMKKKQKRVGLSQRLAQSNKDLSWPDTFGFDNYGMLAMTSTKFQLYKSPGFNFNQVNIRVIRFLTKTSSYSSRGRLICRPHSCTTCG